MSQFDYGSPRAWTPVSLLAKLIRNPSDFLVDVSLTERELSRTLALVWRLYILIKLGDLFPWRSEAMHTGILAGVFIFARPLAGLALRANVPFLNAAVRLAGGSPDRSAALRALTCIFILPNPAICAYVLSPLLARYFGPLAATFALYGVCGVVATVLDGMAIAKSYRLSRMRGAVLVGATSAFACFVYFQIPFYLSDRFSPRVVAGDADLSLLELRKSDIDSTVDGSAWLERIRLDPVALDTTEFAKTGERLATPSKTQSDRLESAYAAMAPFRSATWFDKRKLVPNIPEHPLPGDSALVSLEYMRRIGKYLTVPVIRLSVCLNQGRLEAADSTLGETLRALKALGRADMGLVAAVSQSVYSRRMADRLAEHLPGIQDPHALRRFAATMERYPVDPETILNALRQESYQLEMIFRKRGESAYAEWTRLGSTHGYAFPGYTYRKLLDTAETLDIHRHCWAKIIATAKASPRDDGPPPFEPRRLDYSKNPLVAIVLKNTLGRIWLGVQTPLYTAYARSVRDNRRHAEATRAALLVRARYLESRMPPTLDGIPPSEFASTFSLRNDSLISADSAHSKEVFTVAWR